MALYTELKIYRAAYRLCAPLSQPAVSGWRLSEVLDFTGEPRLQLHAPDGAFIADVDPADKAAEWLRIIAAAPHRWRTLEEPTHES